MHIGIWTKVYGPGYMDMGIWTSAVQCSVVYYCFKCIALRFHAFGFCGWWLLRTRVSLFF